MAKGSPEGRGVRDVESRYKSPEQRRDEWMREMHYRQRNIVYPETAFNSARFWRNLSSRKYPFTFGQKICFAILLVISVPPLFVVFIGLVVYMIRADTSALELITNLPVLGFMVVDSILLYRAFSAVFGEARPFPELPFSARRKMAGQNSKRSEHY